jgi:hypothetical protein
MRRHTDEPSPTALLIGPQLTDWRYGHTDDDTDPGVRWEVRAIFDHDYEQHLLIQQWRRCGDCFTPAGYSLWFIGMMASVWVDEWPRATSAPHLAAAGIVASWGRGVRELNA